jgi:hypothetical protein
MDTYRSTKASVVDLLRYRAARLQGQLDFGAEARPRATLISMAGFRPLTARQVAHRQLMLKALLNGRRP